MNYPSQYKYTKDHEWAEIQGKVVRVGITDHAQSALGDIVFCELPAVGRQLKKGETFGVVESIKAVSDLYSPISGKVIEINSEVVQDPALLNKQPHDQAWMIRLEMTDESEAKALLSSADYQEFLKTV